MLGYYDYRKNKSFVVSQQENKWSTFYDKEKVVQIKSKKVGMIWQYLKKDTQGYKVLGYNFCRVWETNREMFWMA